jgi:hypothetical protein
MRNANLTEQDAGLIFAFHFSIMPKFHLLVLLSILVSITAIASAEDSLLDKAQVRRLTPQEQSTFGPKSGGLRYDARMIRAAQIARQRARPRMTWHCWAYVKDALLAADVVQSRPKSAWARQAGAELCRDYGFKKLSTRNPYDAPVGAVIVYGGNDAGHVELRTASGFASDFISREPYPRPVIGIYVKPA